MPTNILQYPFLDSSNSNSNNSQLHSVVVVPSRHLTFVPPSSIDYPSLR